MLSNRDTVRLVASKETFKHNLREAMQNKFVRSADVCRALNIDKNTFSGWYTGKCLPSPIMLEKLCKYFNMTVDELLYSNSEVPAKTAKVDYMEHLEKLISYYKDGLITSEEYNMLKAKLMETL